MIFIIIDSLERYNFFSRFSRSVANSENILFITTEPLAHFKSFLKKQNSYLLRKETSPSNEEFANTQEEITSVVSSSIEVLNQKILLSDATNDFISITKQLELLILEHKPNKILLWNGQQLLGRCVTKIALAHYIDTIYLEISNLPNKIFCDPVGVNALSSISLDPTILDKLPSIDEGTHLSWMSTYEKYKDFPAPQSKNNYTAKIQSVVNQWLKKPTKSTIKNNIHKSNFKNSLSHIAPSTQCNADYLKSTDYIFLPLQVSGDTQVKLHSSKNNIDAVHYSAEIAQKENLKLIVKIHPAETNRIEIEKIIQLQSTYNFILTNTNTTSLIKNCRKIITINSTVGLEGLLYRKEVVALGKNFYISFDHERLLKYIHGYLVDDVDYFSKTLINTKSIKHILSTTNKTRTN